VPVTAPESCVGSPNKKNSLSVPESVTLFESVMAVLVANCAELPAALLSKWIGLVLLRLAMSPTNTAAVSPAIGVKKRPEELPSAPGSSTLILPCVTVVAPA